MAKPTDEYVNNEFYARFFNLPIAEQRGIIRGLVTILKAQSGAKQQTLPLAEVDSEPEEKGGEPEPIEA